METIYILVVESFNTLVAYQSPLVNPFIFNSLFLILPNLLNGSTFVFFF
jgi:hypothetical protein